jgi:hypothetical protein
MILLTSAVVTKCDLTHKLLYLDEKLESGGSSHEMMKITVYIIDEQA